MVGVVDLGGEEDLVAFDARRFERGADLGLVAVHLGGIDVAVTNLECAAHGVVGVLGRDLVGAEAKHGDGCARRERERGNGGRGRGRVAREWGVHQ